MRLRKGWGLHDKAGRSSTGLSVVSITHEGSPAILVGGDLGTAAAEQVREAVSICLEKSPDRLAIDTIAITSIGAAGISALVDTVSLCRERGVGLELRLDGEARRILDLVGLWWLGVVENGSQPELELEKALRIYSALPLTARRAPVTH